MNQKEVINLLKRRPAGLRNRNPLNIMGGSVKWQGEVGRDLENRCIFCDERYGYRAAFKLLRNYQKLHGICRLDKIIQRWAPESDGNNTKGYIQRVCNYMNCEPDIEFNFYQPSQMNLHCLLVLAMAKVELGEEWTPFISVDNIRWGYDLAFGYITIPKNEEEN